MPVGPDVIVDVVDKESTTTWWEIKKRTYLFSNPKDLTRFGERPSMSSGWQTSHRSEPMPEIMVKIIGSKHFRYVVEKPMM